MAIENVVVANATEQKIFTERPKYIMLSPHAQLQLRSSNENWSRNKTAENAVISAMNL